MRYSPQLDGLRAIACLAVVAFHARVPGFSGGFLGVDVFFVLSGFLITSILMSEFEKSGNISKAEFYKRRALRLYPQYAFLLIAYIIISPHLFYSAPKSRHFRDSLIASIYMSDYANVLDLPLKYLNHTWSLSVEEKFYIVWPFILIAILKNHREQAVKILSFTYIALTIWRFGNYTFITDYSWQVYKRADTHSTGMILGSLLAFCKIDLNRYFSAISMAALTFCINTFTWSSQITVLAGFTATEISTAIIICSSPAILGLGILSWLGKLSYGIYLWHYLAINYCRQTGLEWPETFIYSTSFGIIMSAACYYSFEAAIRRYRERDNGRTKGYRLSQ
ncbi:acyltransferase family protein [Pseudomonas citronellolis]|uniref:acyltransferase family protein n=1 Tax=Pseudomonas citronellolis TaxID=53408 RepID=UPI00078D3BC7|nr:acyltransferase [Pseudomonas citronellolis]AMO77994.1 O-acetyltransferase OatA [Pseudomonas citronellolis]